MSRTRSHVPPAANRGVQTLRVAVLVIFGLVPLSGCVPTAARDTESSADVATEQEILEVPDWMDHMARGDLRALVDTVVTTPIDYHGRVIDQQGQPVAGAEISFSTFDHALTPFEFPFLGWSKHSPVTTGPDGRFALTGVKGAALYFRLAKKGWKTVGSENHYIRYADMWTYRNDHAIPSAEAPREFVMTPGALDDHFLVESGAIRLPADGTEMALRLDRLTPYGVEPHEAQLVIGCDVGPRQPNGRWNWQCRVRMPEGSGVQFRHDLVVAQAPPNGYLPVLEFGQLADADRWDHRGERFLYVKLGEKPQFGHLAVRVRTAGELYVVLDGMVNATGSRELRERY